MNAAVKLNEARLSEQSNPGGSGQAQQAEQKLKTENLNGSLPNVWITQFNTSLSK